MHRFRFHHDEEEPETKEGGEGPLDPMQMHSRNLESYAAIASAFPPA